ncbi:tetratricopeptide repeat-containing sensor histidine kinase [Hymenobacter cavernae]|uniref:histidine kinase n=1 Tax=Hymenobacter cavernae TaxID=2044852 RepID=A0ABQ1UPM3_9BACT|nr:histidine kinase dimerization/phosphoacceptor domain -containing protein [Hymenobacter cavernae]GGF24102.1 hypothetical protein GCM10011383_39690 [Hymenobacter cavernae]
MRYLFRAFSALVLLLTFAHWQNLGAIPLPVAAGPSDTIRVKQWCATAQGLLSINNDSAEARSRHIIRVSRQLDYSYGEAQGYLLLGSALRNKGEFEASLGFSQKALTMFEAKNRARNIAAVYNALALTYKRMGDAQHVKLLTRKALDYAKLARQFARKGPYFPELNRAYISAGIIFRDLGQLDSAAACYLRAMPMAQQHYSRPSSLPVCYADYAQLLMDTNQDLPKAVWYLEQAIPLYEVENNLTGLEHAYRNLSWTYRKQGDYAQALAAADKSLALGRAIRDPHRLVNSLEAAYLAYRAAGQPAHAMDLMAEWKMREDSLLNLEKTQAVAKLEAAYASEKKEAQILRLDEDNAHKVRQLIMLSIGALILGLLLGVMLWQYRTIQHTNAQLQITNKTILENNRHMSEQAVRQTMLMKELHHRVKNNLAIVSSLLRLQSNRLADEMATKAVREGQQRVEAMSLIHQRLYQSDNVTTVDMRRYITDLVESLMTAYGREKETFNSMVRVEQAMLDVELALPLGLILNELLTNAFKHAYHKVAQPALRIYLGHDPEASYGGLLLEVQDNGPGLTQWQWQQATGSFGKRLIDSLTEQIGGTFELSDDTGTLFRLHIAQHVPAHAAT